MRIQRWSIGYGGWAEKAKVVVSCDDEKALWAFLDWLWDWQTWLCHALLFIPLPGFITEWKRAWDKDEPKDVTTFGSWYGDNLGDVWHLAVCSPVGQAIWPHLDNRTVQFELTMAEAEEKFRHDPHKLDWVKNEIAEHKKFEAEEKSDDALCSLCGKSGKEHYPMVLTHPIAFKTSGLWCDQFRVKWNSKTEEFEHRKFTPAEDSDVRENPEHPE